MSSEKLNNRLEQYIAGCDPVEIDLDSKSFHILKARQHGQGADMVVAMTMALMGRQKKEEDEKILESLLELLMDLYLKEKIFADEYTKIERLLHSKDEENKVLGIKILEAKYNGRFKLKYH